ncbi:unnamed protein product [Vitrella brassicaformis CCMP3155]|uniref:Uncharacterized protein n=1 Tax=Vitrella brassicaformis (strain CCMP3155) TaxID=1169540 RepID=A0A0G4G3V5_VITBC|nr:unnamed protein product [Vitrella brassicaformis CCMP3155]|eukprot:CEM23053.1 unnamed protein product [Vitrella brassicaformis CCMP3155]
MDSGEESGDDPFLRPHRLTTSTNVELEVDEEELCFSGRHPSAQTSDPALQSFHNTMHDATDGWWSRAPVHCRWRYLICTSACGARGGPAGPSSSTFSTTDVSQQLVELCQNSTGEQPDGGRTPSEHQLVPSLPPPELTPGSNSPLPLESPVAALVDELDRCGARLIFLRE